MSSPKELQATERDTTLNPRQLRTAGFVPGTLYGKGFESQSIQVREHEFVLALQAGNRDFALNGQNLNVNARVQQLQIDPVTQKPLSVEFLRLDTAAGAKKPAAKKSAKAAAPEAEAVLAGA